MTRKEKKLVKSTYVIENALICSYKSKLYEQDNMYKRLYSKNKLKLLNAKIFMNFNFV